MVITDITIEKEMVNIHFQRINSSTGNPLKLSVNQYLYDLSDFFNANKALIPSNKFSLKKVNSNKNSNPTIVQILFRDFFIN